MPKVFPIVLCALTVATAADALISPAGAAVEYPWCAEYRRAVGGTNCGFVTYQQCLETISGIGGYCYRNPAYSGAREKTRKPRSY
jgi:hypothetical protein